jgi:hypothetical protein
MMKPVEHAAAWAELRVTPYNYQIRKLGRKCSSLRSYETTSKGGAKVEGRHTNRDSRIRGGTMRVDKWYKSGASDFG